MVAAIASSTWVVLVVVLGAVATGCGTHAEFTQGTLDQRAVSPSMDKPLIVPGRGYGPVMLGMKRGEVLESIGEPESQPTPQADQYAEGFAVFYDQDGRVLTIYGGGWCEKDEPMARAFRGATEEGIGIGSTRAEIETGLGPADSVREVQRGLDFLVLQYRSAGVVFALRNDALVHVTILPPRE